MYTVASYAGPYFSVLLSYLQFLCIIRFIHLLEKIPYAQTLG